MGRRKPEQPKRLAEKLKNIRLGLDATHDEMARSLEKEGVKVYRGYIGLYEAGERVPTLLVTFAYARLAGISTDYLIEDYRQND